jgi:hypothetical protein
MKKGWISKKKLSPYGNSYCEKEEGRPCSFAQLAVLWIQIHRSGSSISSKFRSSSGSRVLMTKAGKNTAEKNHSLLVKN